MLITRPKDKVSRLRAGAGRSAHSLVTAWIALPTLLGIGCAHTTASAPAPEAVAGAADDGVAETYRRASDSGDPALYREARDAHATWLTRSAADARAREVRLRYGKILFALGEHRAAADQFAQIASDGRTDYVARSAVRNLILALDHAMAPEAAPGKVRPLHDAAHIDQATLTFNLRPFNLPDFGGKTSVAETPLAADERRLAEACDRYVEIAEPEDAALPTIALLAANIRFVHGQVVAGANRCAEVISRWPHLPSAQGCVNTTVGALSASGAWADLERHARAFRGNLSLIGADHELERQLDRVVQVATFNRIRAATEISARDTAADRGKLVSGADAFVAFQHEFPYSEDADKALYNAFVYYMKSERREQAINAAKLLLAEYRSSRLAGETRRQLKQIERGQ